MYNNPLHPFIVLLKHNRHFGVERLPCPTKEASLELASNLCLQDPEQICIVDRAGMIIYTQEEIRAEYRKFCDETGFREFTFGFNLLAESK
jgi:hypothetical protein